MTAFDRTDYGRDRLDETAVDPDPIVEFERWFAAAQAAGVPEANAMTLATVGPEGANARIVLLKGVDSRGFVFFTHYTSPKGQELAADPRAALVFFWQPIERQVRVTGRAEPVSAAESDQYFASRPEGSQVGAWASTQSAVLSNRAALDAALAEATSRLVGRPIPRPGHWGGYRIVPASVEFWQGRPNRLHDRVRYTRDGSAWRRERLSP